MESKASWTEADFAELSWHDNHVHGMRIREGQHGSGELELDLDFIVRWVRAEGGGVEFDIAPATLTFDEVTDLRISLDYRSVTAGTVPFSIDRIERRLEERERYTAILWRIAVNWPQGEISFEARGFTQVLRAAPLRRAQQSLTHAERSGAS